METMEGKRVLITGGAGFIGSHLTELLIRNGAEITSLDNYFTGTERNHIPGAEYINGDTREIRNILHQRTFDLIYHLGEYSRVEQSFEDIDLVWEYNRKGTAEVIEYAIEKNAKLVYAGSSTKFGDGGLGRDQSPYAWSKASNTELVKNYGNWFGLRYAITYFYNAYGGREIAQGKYSTVVAKFINAYKEGRALTVVSPGTQQRNFTHIDDIINGLLLVGLHGSGDEFGIGAKDSYSILDLAKLFEADIEFLPPRRGNRAVAAVITEKTERLGWSASHNLEKYINSVIKSGSF